jgi:hypothetical protein
LQLAQLHDGKRVSVTTLYSVSKGGDMVQIRLCAKVEVDVKTLGLHFFSDGKQKIGDVWL